MREFFPSWYAIRRHEEVVVFTCGQMADPRPLIEHAYEMWIERWLNRMRFDQVDHQAEGRLEAEDKDTESLKLFNSLEAESQVHLDWNPYHNEYINRYDHRADDFQKRPRDTTSVYSPSRVYLFDCINTILTVGTEDKKEGVERQKAPECAMRIYQPDPSLQHSVLTICEQICQKQTITDLCLIGLYLRDFKDASIFKMSKNAKSFVLFDCELHADFLRSLLHQLSDCAELQKLVLGCRSLCDVEKELGDVLEKLIAHQQRRVDEHGKKDQPWLTIVCDASISKEFENKWKPRCKEMKVDLWTANVRNLDTSTLTFRGYVRPDMKTDLTGFTK